MAHDHKPIILIVDDEQAILTSMKNILQDGGCLVETTTNPNDVLNLIGSLIPDLVFLDVFIPNANGIELLAAIKKEFPAQTVVIISGYGNISLAVEALKKGAIDFLEKPFSADDLLSKVAVYCPTEGGAHADRPLEGHSNLIGESYLFKELMHYVDRVVPLDNHLMIYGPRGIGKTHLAQYIHDKKNAAGELTIINGIQNPILDDKLFLSSSPIPTSSSPPFNTAHPEPVEGSLDGVQDKLRRGPSPSPLLHSSLSPQTIVIKHVDALTPEAQKNLLAMLENPATKARIICLTHKNLFALSTQGAFNEDLFYALSSTPIEIPSLNKRRFDIPLLVHHFLALINKELNTSLACSAATIRLLRNYVWQGHCRELKQLLMRVATNLPSDTSVITPEHVAQFLSETDRSFVEEQRFRSFTTLDEATSAFQKKYLLYQLKKNRFDLNQASNALSMSITDLHNEIARLNISLSI